MQPRFTPYCGAIQAARQGGLCWCAVRSVPAALRQSPVWLVRTGRMADLDAALTHLRAKRPRLALGTAQQQAVVEALVG
jgi:hypothetical protein